MSELNRLLASNPAVIFVDPPLTFTTQEGKAEARRLVEYAISKGWAKRTSDLSGGRTHAIPQPAPSAYAPVETVIKPKVEVPRDLDAGNY